MRKTRIGKIAAGFMAATLVLQSAFVPVMADDQGEAAVGEVMQELSQFTGAEPVGVEISFSGSIAGSPEVEGSIVTAVDPLQAASSFSGMFSASGISVEFGGYADKDQLMLAIPGIPKILSLSFNSDLSNSFIGQMLGKEQTEMISKMLQLCSAAADPMSEKMQKFGQDISDIINDAIGQLQIESADQKECMVGGESVVCQGMQVVIPQDLVKSVVDKFLAVELPNGQTYEDYFDMILSVQKSSGSSAPASVKDVVASTLDTMPSLTLLMYVTENNALAELDLVAENSTVSVQLRGPEAAPWTEMAVLLDGTEMVLLAVDLSESGFTGTLKVQGSEVATLDFDMEDLSFKLNITGMPFAIMGNVEHDDEGITINLLADAMSATIRLNEDGGTVEKPEGDVLDIGSMTQEDFNALAGSIGSIFGGAAAQQGAA